MTGEECACEVACTDAYCCSIDLENFSGSVLVGVANGDGDACPEGHEPCQADACCTTYNEQVVFDSVLECANAGPDSGAEGETTGAEGETTGEGTGAEDAAGESTGAEDGTA